ncbi:putative antitoxin of gyrase inhibiting toxin-antitoxin system [Escherichia coli]|uniref:Putative antitoxin of gyrase inhibiting toxin-antitoxin system n=1 Tax=Escherichia coli TaxID=562 RepID=A0A376VQG5_ECOLX|nr:putative antitoxin of gyrase inhibiting toxin-antitoxin system [Escherichia coli]
MTAKRTTQSVTVTVDRELVNRARDAGLNMSATLTVALNAEIKKNMQQTRWREENAEAIAALNQLADETGCFLMSTGASSDAIYGIPQSRQERRVSLCYRCYQRHYW